MLNTGVLAEIISDYKEHFDKIHKDEIYKWKAVKCFQDNWDENAVDFPAMLDKALGKAANLLDSYNYYPKGMICRMAERDPEAARAMFKTLFDEHSPVTERIILFIESADELRLKYGGGSWNNHFQTPNSVSIYLFFRYPTKYYIYKYRKFKDFAAKIEYTDVPKMGKPEGVQKYFDMCNEILKAIEQNNDLLNMSKSRLTEEYYPDGAFHILTEDIIFFGSRNAGETVDRSWWPSEDEYSPGIDKAKWLELLSDNNVFTPNSKLIMKRMLDIGGEATCTQLSQKYGESANFYNRGSSGLAERVWRATGCDILLRNNENSRWWTILYVGKRANKNAPGAYI
jgi:5-methylcytosine-specific restriction protein B